MTANAGIPAPTEGLLVSLFLTVRDIEECHRQWSAKGASFVTPPLDRGAEIRCYLRDPDGYLIEVGQSTGLLHGQHADPASGR
jgi:predicted enzyme related to lactoylglutathione lyase